MDARRTWSFGGKWQKAMEIAREEINSPLYIVIPQLNLGKNKQEESRLGKPATVKLSMDEGLLPSVVDYNLSFKENNYMDLMSLWKPSPAPASSYWLYEDRHLQKAVLTAF